MFVFCSFVIVPAYQRIHFHGEFDTLSIPVREPGGFAIRHSLAFSLVFALCTTKAHADLVSYTMTGTIQEVSGYQQQPGNPPVPVASLPIAVGDRISWTLQYDRATPVSNAWSAPNLPSYLPSGPMLSHLVDQTNGYHVYTSPAGSIPANNYDTLHPLNPYTLVGLANLSRGGHVGFFDYRPGLPGSPVSYSLMLGLDSHASLPTLNLDKLRLDQVLFQFHDPSIPAQFQFRYNGQIPETQSVLTFDARINSLTPDASIQSVPEPATWTLFVLAAVGFAARPFRRVFIHAR